MRQERSGRGVYDWGQWFILRCICVGACRLCVRACVISFSVWEPDTPECVECFCSTTDSFSEPLGSLYTSKKGDNMMSGI